MNTQEIGQKLFETFVGRTDVFAVADDHGGFHPVHNPLELSYLVRHLNQVACAGFYVMLPDNTVVSSAIDFDGKHEADWQKRTAAVADWLRSAGLEPLVEVSQSGAGAHVWLLFSERIEAWLVRAFWRWVLERAQVQCREIFPKQDSLAGTSKGLGNLIRFPLWEKSRFVDAEWQDLDTAVALADVALYARDDLIDLATRGGAVLRPDPTIGAPSEPGDLLPSRVHKAISRGLCKNRWDGDTGGLTDRSRSGVAFSFVAHLIRSFVPTAEIEIGLRAWCERHDVLEKGARPNWVRQTVNKAYDMVWHQSETASQHVDTFEGAMLHYLDSLGDESIRWYDSGIAPLDLSYPGVGPGEILVVAARPSHGKSAFAIQWADWMACHHHVPVLFVSEEMSEQAIGSRLVARVLRIDENTYSKAVDAECRSLTHAHYEGAPPVFLVNSVGTIERLEEMTHQAVASDGVGALVIDYTQLLRARAERRTEAVAQVSQRLRQLTTQHRLMTLAVVQLNREIERRIGKDNKLPRMSDIGDSGQIERDADVIMVCQWPHRDDDSMPSDRFLFHVLKRRNGPVCVPLVMASFNATAQMIS